MKIAIALSGGFDSAVAAYLLKEKKYELIGITFELFESQKNILEKTKNIAHLLEIPHHILDLKETFKREIISYFIDSYAKGLTPNPCAWCNRKIKFGKVLEFAIKNLKIEKFATGHYVKIESYKENLLLKRAKDKDKDQSYFLALINCEIIPYLLFP
ncbi:MAG: tRNA 2-thiouridine(34) synthase MnmA, partial [Thermodesulfobacterium geofontis]